MNSKPTGETFAVVGGSGFLGRYIVEGLLDRGETKVPASSSDFVLHHLAVNRFFQRILPGISSLYSLHVYAKSLYLSLMSHLLIM
jgi:NAD(P)-dependent dehydrogenase (short-subunit alcohol dehydrogenase family)